MKSLLLAFVALFMLLSATCEQEETPPYHCEVSGVEFIDYGSTHVYNVTVHDLPSYLNIVTYEWEAPAGLQVEGLISGQTITLTHTEDFSHGPLCVNVFLSNGEYVRCCIDITCSSPCTPPPLCCTHPTLQGVHKCLTSTLCGGGKSGVLQLGFEEGPIADCVGTISEVCYSVSEGILADSGTSSLCFDLDAGETLPPNGEILFCSEHCFGQSFDAMVIVSYNNGETPRQYTTVVDGGCDCN